MTTPCSTLQAKEVPLKTEHALRVYAYDPGEQGALSTPRLRLPLISQPLIFEHAWASSLAQKATSVGVGALFWAVWVALWLPLGTAALWLIVPGWGLGAAIDDGRDSLPLMVLVLGVGVALASWLILVGAWEWARDRPVSANDSTADVTPAELAQAEGLETADLLRAWQHRRLVVHHREDGKVSRVQESMPREGAIAASARVEL